MPVINQRELICRPTAESAAEEFRLAMRGFAASVAIVASAEAGVRAGIVATAVMSISLTPPSLMVAINRFSSCLGLFLRRRAFSVNLLNRQQAEVASRFNKRKPNERFCEGRWEYLSEGEARVGGLPFLCDAQANIFCNIDEAIESHTHTLLIGRVRCLRSGQGIDPLLYCDGQYGRFDDLQGRSLNRERRNYEA
jgi:flavin reductase (DIM6/NTAB) family NADH-FMN oxidoreductase RutF